RERPVTFDPDGTGELAVLVLKDGKKLPRPNGPEINYLLRITALRATTGEKLWEAEHDGLSLELRQAVAHGDNRRACDRPAPFRTSTQADDRREDLLLPFKEQRMAAHFGTEMYWHGVARLDGRTGKAI